MSSIPLVLLLNFLVSYHAQLTRVQSPDSTYINEVRVAFEDVQRNKRLEGYVLLYVGPTSYMDCIIYCAVNNKCQSINYFDGTEKNCQLNSVTRIGLEDNLANKNGPWYYVGPLLSRLDCSSEAVVCEFPTECRNMSQPPGYACVRKDLLSSSYESVGATATNDVLLPLDNNSDTCLPPLENNQFILYQPPAYWQIKFKRLHTVEGLVVKSGSFLIDAEVVLVDETGEFFACGELQIAVKQAKKLVCRSPRNVKGVKIMAVSGLILILCEVEIYGRQ